MTNDPSWPGSDEKPPKSSSAREAWREWFVRQHPLALASMVLSVFSFTHLGTLWVDEIAGIILGVLAIRAVKARRIEEDDHPCLHRHRRWRAQSDLRDHHLRVAIDGLARHPLMSCFTLLLFLAAFVMIMVTFIRWFEQTTEAVDNGWWNKIFVLLDVPVHRVVFFRPGECRDAVHRCRDMNRARVWVAAQDSCGAVNANG
jgi:hypothetical protein